ncbi:hypothetical protein HZH68_011189 [Vespula germanica]|uniref:Transmembrane protein n=2 Tax=Vespula TaxID=7451 RepID=A0A834JQ94_VESGE|nr:uncharacterized protein LOC122632912 isoform X2 [Vespula pensylvanica]XP_050858499.1 uncharacterized protein LOC127067521 isoform X2 [Vespula vulgaris]KAF7391646.1 hypothetical protein HZH68_011189 [Vespula germanica]KAF7415761.1 hypothetical protein H0235_012353 [Vespula pensylvanica]
MPDSGAVYQPTTVGYTYDSGGDGTGSAGGIRSGFWRIASRHKINSRKWLEWTLLSVGLSFFVVGLTTMLVSLVSSDDINQRTTEVKQGSSTGASIEVEENVEETSRGSVAIGAGMMFVGILLSIAWAWLRFFQRSKSPRGGITGGSGQYGPVLTELPSQLKLKEANIHETLVAPLSDQEEETLTLMLDPNTSTTLAVDPNSAANQIPG